MDKFYSFLKGRRTQDRNGNNNNNLQKMADTRGGVDLEAQQHQQGVIPMAQVVPGGPAAQMDAQVAADLNALDKMERSIRHAFARKVFSLLAMMLIVMMGVICIFLYVPPARVYASSRASTWLVVVSGFLFLLTLIALSCIPELGRRYPVNMIGLLLVSIEAGVFIGVLTGGLDPNYVWIAFATTMGIMTVLGIFACQTKYDFTGIGPYLSVGIMFLLIFSLFTGFSPYLRNDFSNGSRSIVWMAIAIFIFSMYVVYDMQLVIGGKHRLRFSVDDYVVATISLFTDFIMIFTLVLGALGGSQN